MGTSIALSHSTNHYVRIYAILEHGAKKANESIGEIGYVLHCFKCFHREIVKEKFPVRLCMECSKCRSRMSVTGPLWLGRIVNKQFCASIEDEVKRKPFRLGGRIRKILGLLKNEAEAPVTYYVLEKLCSAFSLPVPSVHRVLEALREDGFQACLTHFDPGGIKSDVSAGRIVEILKETVRV